MPPSLPTYKYLHHSNISEFRNLFTSYIAFHFFKNFSFFKTVHHLPLIPELLKMFRIISLMTNISHIFFYNQKHQLHTWKQLLFIHTPNEGHSVCFQFSAITSETSTNIHIQVSVKKQKTNLYFCSIDSMGWDC